MYDLSCRFDTTITTDISTPAQSWSKKNEDFFKDLLSKVIKIFHQMSEYLMDDEKYSFFYEEGIKIIKPLDRETFREFENYLEANFEKDFANEVILLAIRIWHL